MLKYYKRVILSSDKKYYYWAIAVAADACYNPKWGPAVFRDLVSSFLEEQGKVRYAQERTGGKGYRCCGGIACFAFSRWNSSPAVLTPVELGCKPIMEVIPGGYYDATIQQPGFICSSPALGYNVDAAHNRWVYITTRSDGGKLYAFTTTR